MRILMILAWRNIWRHPARSGVLLAAIAVGLWAGTLATGATSALMRQRIAYLIENEITHVQVHHPQFAGERLVHHILPDLDAIQAWLADDDRVLSASARVIVDGMLQSPIRTSAASIRGIDPGTETRTTTFHENMVAGEYLDTDLRNAVIVGRELAADHNLETGQRIVLNFETLAGDLTAAAFNIAGLFESASTDFDRRTVFVRAADLEDLLEGGPARHELAVLLREEQDAAAVAAALNDAFPDAEARTWRELSPELNTLVELGNVMLFIITLIIMAALAFGILNTLLMALFERLREFSMLISIGMSRRRVFAMMLLESALLTALGSLSGMALGMATIRRLGRTGLRLDHFAGGAAMVGWDSTIYPSITPAETLSIVLVVVAVTLLASCYPAWKAMRIQPLEAAKDF